MSLDIPGIRGERIRLVPIDAQLHLDNCLRWMNDPEVARWLARNTPISRLAEQDWFERTARSECDIVWAILDEDGRHIGMTGVHGIGRYTRTATTGIVIGEKDAWRKGYGSEVLRVRTRWLFEELGLHRLESECFAENLASARCLEKAGYRRIGVARAKYWREGMWKDGILFEMLEEDWFAMRGERQP